MTMANRIFNKKQALEKEVKELYVKGTFANSTAATASAATTTPIVYTSVALGPARNTKTITIQVVAPAANPSNTVLVVFTGTAAAITITVTPNDGTNNTATPVTVTTANLVQLINTGLITGKTPTITDASSLRALQTATGGDTTPLADGGEGDGVAATFSGGDMSATMSSGYGVTSITRNGVGTWDVVLNDRWFGFRSFYGIILKSTGEDILFQTVSTSTNQTPGILTFMTKTGATATDPSTGLVFFLRLELKNTSAV